MNEIRLNKLILRDFQGGSITLDAEGKDVFIYAANAGGKTRLVSAFSWLFFNKDALGRADFQIKNLDAQGEPTHGLEHTVSADLDVNGEPVSLRKVFKEKWTKKRGSADREFSGHTTEYFFNGVPIQEKDYLARIAEIAGDESRFRLLTSPMTFPALHWQKQRQLLLEICGDITDADVIASDEKLFPLTAILGKRTLDDHRKIVTARRSEINEAMEQLPIRIDEVRRSLPDVTGIDRKAAETDAQRLDAALNDAKMRLQGVNTGGAIADLSKRLSGLNADLRAMEDKHRSGSLATLNRLNQQISEVDAKVNASRRRMAAIDADLKAKDAQHIRLNSDLSDLRNKWTTVDGWPFKDSISDTCPACGQALPSDRVQEARDKALASFNSDKAEKLGDIDRRGHSLKDQRDKLRAEIEALGKERETLSEVLPGYEESLKVLTGDRDALKEGSADFSEIPGRSDILDEIDALEGQIQDEREGKAGDLEKIKTEVTAAELGLRNAKAKVDLFVQREKGDKRITELMAEEKRLAAEFEMLEGELFLIETFIRTKTAMLTDRINSKFTLIKWKLFENLVNGGVQEICQATIGGVPFDSGLNSAGRTQAGVEIVSVLQGHFGLSAPLWLDNRESCTEIPPVKCQVISLYVSPEDKVLRVEMVRERMAA
jgi:hypothetical protein